MGGSQSVSRTTGSDIMHMIYATKNVSYTYHENKELHLTPKSLRTFIFSLGQTEHSPGICFKVTDVLQKWGVDSGSSYLVKAKLLSEPRGEVTVYVSYDYDIDQLSSYNTDHSFFVLKGGQLVPNEKFLISL